MFWQLAASPLFLERPICVPAATRRCILVSSSLSSSGCESWSGCHGVWQVCLCVCVTIAEKVTSLGKDWHRPCLRCERCSKTLSAGSHAEVRERRRWKVGRTDFFFFLWDTGTFSYFELHKCLMHKVHFHKQHICLLLKPLEVPYHMFMQYKMSKWNDNPKYLLTKSMIKKEMLIN